MPTIKQYRGLYDSRYANKNTADIINGIWTFTLHPLGLDHTQLANIGVNTHPQIDNHIADTTNPHNVTAAQVGAAPVGTIVMFGGAVAPIGWVLCDGTARSRTVTYDALFAAIGTTFGIGDGATTFNVPDMRGIFPRGAGTSGKLNQAEGAAFAGVLGTYQNDKFQAHRHQVQAGSQHDSSTYLTVRASSATRDKSTDSGVYREDTSGGTYGAPRWGLETNPANLGLTFIIKY